MPQTKLGANKYKNVKVFNNSICIIWIGDLVQQELLYHKPKVVFLNNIVCMYKQWINSSLNKSTIWFLLKTKWIYTSAVVDH